MAELLYKVLLSVYAVVLVSGFVDSCPYQICECILNTVFCDDKGMQNLPAITSENIVKPITLRLINNSLTTIPAGSLPANISIIFLQQNPVTSIHKDAFRSSANTLTGLWFSGARFTQLPDAFLSLNKLNHLEISDTPITFWSDEIMEHIGAKMLTLRLSNVSINSWPTWIQYLPHVATLELSSSSFLIPDNGFDNQINSLSTLNLENDGLTDIPSAVTKLTQLKELILDNNNVSKITGILNSPNFLSLSMNSNRISDAGQLSKVLLSVASSLTNLLLNKNQLTYLPDLSALVKLETVYLYNNSITYTGTSKISSSLKHLDLGNNNLQSLDSFVRNGINLTQLQLQNNSITEIHGLDIPASVQDLDMSYNLLEELTDESFPHNSKMLNLYLDYNPISKVSSMAFANIKELTLLAMSYTKITRLPVSLTYLTSVKSIALMGNDALICTCLEKAVRSVIQQHHKVGFFGQCGVTSVEHFINVMSAQCPH